MKRYIKTIRNLCMPFLLVITLPANGSDKNTSANALERYIDNGDNSYAWKTIDSIRTTDVKVYRLRLVSQTWHEIPWIHEVEIIVPHSITCEDALLFVSGGSLNENGEPNMHGWDNNIIQAMTEIAKDCRAITAIIWQVPRQPLFKGLYEDEIVSLTFHNFLKDRDHTWPLLFPMAKSAIRAMDAVQDFSKTSRAKIIPRNFLITGFSKRGWTSWMAAATGDKRIKAIAPAVNDILNMSVNVPYQKFIYGNYSVQIQDYVKLGITEAFGNTEGNELKNMIDPYSYRKKIKIPKLLLMGTNDEYWTVDAVKNYLYGLKGETCIKYNPNVGHSLGDKKEAMNTLKNFFWKTIHHQAYTKLECKVKQKGNELLVKVKSSDIAEEITLWKAYTSNRDFRKSEFKPLEIVGNKNISTTLKMPSEGSMAFFIMAKYKSPISEEKAYTLTSRMYFCEPGKLYDKPYKP